MDDDYGDDDDGTRPSTINFHASGSQPCLEILAVPGRADGGFWFRALIDEIDRNQYPEKGYKRSGEREGKERGEKIKIAPSRRLISDRSN